MASLESLAIRRALAMQTIVDSLQGRARVVSVNLPAMPQISQQLDLAHQHLQVIEWIAAAIALLNVTRLDPLAIAAIQSMAALSVLVPSVESTNFPALVAAVKLAIEGRDEELATARHEAERLLAVLASPAKPEPLPTIGGVLSQIDNAVAGLYLRKEKLERDLVGKQVQPELPSAEDLGKLTKVQLAELAISRGVSVAPSNTKAEIIAALTAPATPMA